MNRHLERPPVTMTDRCSLLIVRPRVCVVHRRYRYPWVSKPTVLFDLGGKVRLVCAPGRMAMRDDEFSIDDALAEC